jgi:photosystem II stability/assembly factor-like uncharacterized protein
LTSRRHRAPDIAERYDAFMRNVSYDYYSVCFITPKIGAIAGGGIILRTTDEGTTWTMQPARADGLFGNWGVYFTNAETGTIVGDGGLIQRTTTGGVGH